MELRSVASWKRKGGVEEEGCKRREDFKADKVNFNFGAPALSKLQEQRVPGAPAPAVNSSSEESSEAESNQSVRMVRTVTEKTRIRKRATNHGTVEGLPPSQRRNR